MSSLTVFNIRKEKYSDSLTASGMPNRWNKANEFVIYTGSSRSLSVLELLVHRSGINPDLSYKIMNIQTDINEEDIEIIEKLPKGWLKIESYPILQEIGSKWYNKREKLALKVPSSVVPQEFNYILNTFHSQFYKKVKIKEIEDFLWDKRLF